MLQEAARHQPNLRVVWAEGDSRGLLAVGVAPPGGKLLLIAKPVGLKTVVVLPGRWVVQRVLAWLNCFRCLVAHCERTLAGHMAWLLKANMTMTLRQGISD